MGNEDKEFLEKAMSEFKSAREVLNDAIDEIGLGLWEDAVGHTVIAVERKERGLQICSWIKNEKLRDTCAENHLDLSLEIVYEVSKALEKKWREK